MAGPDGLVEWLHRQVDEDEWWAREASRRDDGEGAPGGIHWQWECNEHDQPAGMDPALDELLRCPVDEDCFCFGLRSVEDFPTSVGPLPVFSVPSAEEQPVAPAGHIVRHDPARVLAQVAAHRAILDLHAAHDYPYDPDNGPGNYAWTPRCDHCHHEWPCPTVRHLATMYADRDGYDQSWRP